VSLVPGGAWTRVERLGLAFSLVIAILLMWPLRTNVTDDTFVHLQYARHLAQGRGPVLNVGERVYGCTSPLWVALLADAMVIGMNGLIAARTIGLLATLASVALFMQLMRRTLRLAPLRALATLVFSAHAGIIEWSMSGMETSLAVALTLAGFVALVEGKQFGARPVRTGTLWALAALTRPEVVLLLVVWGTLLLIDVHNRTGLRRLVFAMLPPVVIYGAWLLFARFYFGTFWPRALDLSVTAGDSFRFGHLWDVIRMMLSMDGTKLALLAVAVVFAGKRLWPGNFIAQRLVPLAWVLLLPGLYIARGFEVENRHLLLLAPAISWLTWRAAEVWWLGDDPESTSRRQQATVLGFVAASLMLVTSLSTYHSTVRPRVERASATLRESLIPWGDWLAVHAPSGSTIGAAEIGALAYIGNMEVVDLTGRHSPGISEYGEGRSPARLAGELRFPRGVRPDFLVVRSSRAYDLLDKSPWSDRLIPIGRAPGWEPRGVPRPDSVYSFYRVDPVAYAMRDSAK
jgi:hypothetical protein